MGKYCVVASITLAVSACASNVEVAYPAPGGASQTGIVLVRFTESMQGVSVRIDGVLVAEDRHTERVLIANVPVGSREVRVVGAAGGRSDPVDHTERVTITSGEQSAVLVATPARSVGSWILNAALVLVYGALLLEADDRGSW